MLKLNLLLALGCILYSGFVAADINTDIASQSQRSLALMLQNISRPDTARGVVVAAPSRTAPDYFYHWIRDAALVMDSIVQVYGHTSGPMRATLKQTITDYVAMSRRNQLTPNKSGGLGEPKFNVDGSAFNGDWGRPQNDGPALRAIALIHFATIMLKEGQGTYVRQVLYDGKIPTESVIKADLEYVAHHWQDSCVDLWEEIGGHHFYNAMVSRRAMIEGAALATALGDGGAAAFYRQQASAIAQATQQFWDGNRKILVATVGQTFGVKKSGLDVAVVLGVLHGETYDGFLSPSNDMVLSTAFNIISAFEAIYPINHGSKVGPAIGRYPEDVYNGTGTSEGSPWFLATLAYAELCNRVRVEYTHVGAIKVSILNKPFLDMALQGHGTVQPGTTISKGDPLFAGIISGLGQLGDQFFRTVLLHRAADGSLSEQFNRHTGYEQGAPNLSWSHASFITGAMWRGLR